MCIYIYIVKYNYIYIYKAVDALVFTSPEVAHHIRCRALHPALGEMLQYLGQGGYTPKNGELTKMWLKNWFTYP